MPKAVRIRALSLGPLIGASAILWITHDILRHVFLILVVMDAVFLNSLISLVDKVVIVELLVIELLECVVEVARDLINAIVAVLIVTCLKVCHLTHILGFIAHVAMPSQAMSRGRAESNHTGTFSHNHGRLRCRFWLLVIKVFKLEHGQNGFGF